jgi:hypothetical protein
MMIFLIKEVCFFVRYESILRGAEGEKGKRGEKGKKRGKREKEGKEGKKGKKNLERGIAQGPKENPLIREILLLRAIRKKIP